MQGNTTDNLMKEYVHIKPGEEGVGLAWPYTIVTEERIKFKEKEILCLIAESLSGSICVGIGTVQFIYIPGYIIAWQIKMDKNDRPVSIVEPLKNADDKISIKKIITERFPSLQICF